MGGGVVGDQVTIPCLMISQADCATIRAQLPGVDVNVFWDPIVPSDDVLWGGNPGEGDFDGGLNGWTVVNEPACSDTFDLWRWNAEANGAIGGAFSAGGGIIQSPSACNGHMAFDSDFYDNGGDSGNQGGGDCPSPHTGELISPPIDISSFGVAGISVQFWQATRQFTSSYFLSYSNDNGMTWIDSEINSELETNGGHLNFSVRHFLPEADLQADSFRIKFRYEANYYYWQIDDVQLVETEANNLRVMSNWYAVAPNAATPGSQVEEYSHLADVYNAGSESQTGVALTMTINDGTSDVFTDELSVPYNPFEPDTLIENEPMPGFFMPSDVPGTQYNAAYFISADSMDFDLSDNSQFYDFEISDTVFSKENGATTSIRPGDAGWEDGENHSWAFGNYYRIVNGTDWNAGSVTFAIGAPDIALIGTILTLYLYDWDEFATPTLDNNMDPEERTRVAYASYVIDGTETQDSLITLEWFDFLTDIQGPVALYDGMNAVVMLEYLANDDVTNLFIASSDQRNYGAMALRSEEVEGIADDGARYGELLGIDEDLDGIPYETSGFTSGVVPVIRLNLSLVTAVDETLDEANVVEISPNPADNQINLNIDLVETLERANIRILDLNGRLIYERHFEDIRNESLLFDVSAYAPGAYFLHFVTEKGVRTKRFIVQH